jgi:hypothetical protein
MAPMTDDTARFFPDDVEEVVSASFVCPTCLGAPARATMTTDPYVPFVRCECDGCAAAWLVHLTGLQYVRLRIAPPAVLAGMTLDAAPAEEPRYWRW